MDVHVWKCSNLGKQQLMTINGLLAQCIYLVILGLAFISFIKQKVSIASIMAIFIVICTLLPHIIVEVRPRYHHYMMPFIILSAGYGLQMLKQKHEECVVGEK